MKEERREVSWAGDGTEEKPYEIKTKVDLVNLCQYVEKEDCEGKFFRQEADIDLSEDLVGKDGAWNPIGDMEHPFNGTYIGRGSDGKRHKIRNLSIVLQAGATMYCGLFGYLGTKAAVRGLWIEKVTLDICISNARVGVIAGVNHGEICDCCVSIDKLRVKDGSSAGGIAGIHETGSIKDCFVSGDLQGEGATGAIGGIAGQNEAEIASCYYNGMLIGEPVSYIGGIAGNFGDKGKDNADSGISFCYSLARIQGEKDHIGGICGMEIPTKAEHCHYLKSYVNNGNAVGTGKDLQEMLEETFLKELNGQEVNRFFRPEGQKMEEKTYEFTPALSVFQIDAEQKEMLSLLQESASAVDLETLKIVMTEESDEQADFSWKIRNASMCTLQLGEKTYPLATEVEKSRQTVGDGDDITGNLKIKNPYMKREVIQGFCQRKPVYIGSFTVERNLSKIQKIVGDIGDGFLDPVRLTGTDEAEDYQVSYKTPPSPPVHKYEYTCKWEVKRAKKDGITISSGSRTYSGLSPDKGTYDYDSDSDSATLTAVGEGGEKRTKTDRAKCKFLTDGEERI